MTTSPPHGPYPYEATLVPERCDGCSHTLRDGELVERLRWRGRSGDSEAAVLHYPRCPVMVSTVPCPPCLYVLLDGEVDDPRYCDLTTVVTVDAVQVLVGRERDCPCRGKHPSC
ncbi:hypothetical protein SALBM135S_02765 [Streptomyces alboniger]